MGNDDDTETQEQQCTGWRSTYLEHSKHVRHRAHVPITDGLIEGTRNLQCSGGRTAIWSEGRSRSEGRGGATMTTTTTGAQRRGGEIKRDGGTRTMNMPAMFDTAPVFHPPMG
jgi:hypothetical protein